MEPAVLTPEDVEFLRRLYLKEPDKYVKEVLGAKTWYMQDEIINSVFRNKITAVKTCNAVGKSFVAARIALAYLMLYPNSIVVTTAPTWSQVTDVLWREIASAVKTSKYQLTEKEVTQAGLNLGEKWYAVGRSPKRPENLFGFHADHILVIIDEAGGVEEPLFTGVAAITPNRNARVLLIGNPTKPSGKFYDYFTKPELGAKCFTISAFDSPNFTALNIKTIDDLIAMYKPQDGFDQIDWMAKVNAEIEDRLDPIFGGLIDPSTVYSRYYEFGPDSAAWQSLIMGEFPTMADQQLIPTDLVVMAMHMKGLDEDSGKTYAELTGWNIPDGAPEYGLDIARFGPDLNVLTPRRGGWVDQQIIWNKKGDEKKELYETAEHVLKVIDVYDPNSRLDLDDTGLGGGVTSHLRFLSNQEKAAGRPGYIYQLADYNFASKIRMQNPKKFHDITTELYWNLRGWFMRHEISIPNDMKLRDELIARRWTILPNGKLKVESKDEYKKRTGGKSPDHSDSLALAFAGGYREERAPRTPLDADEYVPQRKPYTSGLNRGGSLSNRQW
jgi:phage terminase large subunit